MDEADVASGQLLVQPLLSFGFEGDDGIVSGLAGDGEEPAVEDFGQVRQVSVGHGSIAQDFEHRDGEAVQCGGEHGQADCGGRGGVDEGVGQCGRIDVVPVVSAAGRRVRSWDEDCLAAVGVGAHDGAGPRMYGVGGAGQDR
jgi:hypothetical protein